MALLQVNLNSNVLHMDTKIWVIMPQKMQGIGLPGGGGREQFPVLWLLHGRSDDCTIWLRRTSIERYVAPLGLMVIMPEVSYSRYREMDQDPAKADEKGGDENHIFKAVGIKEGFGLPQRPVEKGEKPGQLEKL